MGVLFGNRVEDTKECILLGQDREKKNGKMWLKDARRAEQTLVEYILHNTAKMKRFFWILLIGNIFMWNGCNTLTNTCDTAETQRLVDRRVDSVSVRDSIVVHHVNDTVRVEKWHTQWKERIVMKQDTVYVTKIQKEEKTTPARRVSLREIMLWLIVIVLLILLWRR